MNNTKEGNSRTAMLVLSAAVFVLCTLAGMLTAYKADGKLFNSLSDYISKALAEKNGFKEVFFNALRSDFRYTCAVLVCTLNIYTAVIPLFITGFKGFSAGLAVAVASRILESGSVTAISAAVFFSCVFTVPIYIFMFMLCFSRAKRAKNSAEPFAERFKDYILFAAAVMFLFALLCLTDCIQAAAEPFICALANSPV